MSERPSVVETEDEEMNLTPLLDCIFILVFFFLAATTLRDEQSRIEVQLPRAAATPTENLPQSLEVVITAQGEIMIAGDKVEPAGLDQALTTLTESRPGEPVEVVSDAQAPMQSFVDVISALSRLGIAFTNLRTEPQPATP
jgi:biopolymer transport protein ExbD